MFSFRNCKKEILQLELTIEHQQKQLNELRTIVLTLSSQIDKLQTQIEELNKTKYGKSL
jgi:cell division protein FtsB